MTDKAQSGEDDAKTSQRRDTHKGNKWSSLKQLIGSQFGSKGFERRSIAPASVSQSASEREDEQKSGTLDESSKRESVGMGGKAVTSKVFSLLNFDPTSGKLTLNTPVEASTRRASLTRKSTLPLPGSSSTGDSVPTSHTGVRRMSATDGQKRRLSATLLLGGSRSNAASSIADHTRRNSIRNDTNKPNDVDSSDSPSSPRREYGRANSRPTLKGRRHESTDEMSTTSSGRRTITGEVTLNLHTLMLQPASISSPTFSSSGSESDDDAEEVDFFPRLNRRRSSGRASVESIHRRTSAEGVRHKGSAEGAGRQVSRRASIDASRTASRRGSSEVAHRRKSADTPRHASDSDTSPRRATLAVNVDDEVSALRTAPSYALGSAIAPSTQQSAASPPGSPKGHGAKDTSVDAAADARTMAARHARLIQQLITDSADDASKAHERWLRRRLLIRQEGHRSSFTSKSEERADAETRRMAMRLRRRRKNGVSLRLTGTISTQGAGFRAVIGRESLGADSESLTPKVEKIKVAASTRRSKEVAPVGSVFQQNAVTHIQSVTPDTTLAVDAKYSRNDARPHTAPSVETCCPRSMCSSTLSAVSGTSTSFNNDNESACTPGSPFPPLIDKTNSDRSLNGSRLSNAAELNTNQIVKTNSGAQIIAKAKDELVPDGFGRLFAPPCPVTIAHELLSIDKSSGSQMQHTAEEKGNAKAASASSSDDEFAGFGEDDSDTDVRQTLSLQAGTPKSALALPMQAGHRTPAASPRSSVGFATDHAGHRTLGTSTRSSTLAFDTGENELDSAGGSKRSGRAPARASFFLRGQLSQARRERLPELPRLRSKFRDYRFILRDQWRHEASTVKRLHLHVAEELGLEDEDWSWMGCIYTITLGDLAHAAELKAEKEILRSVIKLQNQWRSYCMYKVMQKLLRRRKLAAELVQRWWHMKLAFQWPLKFRLKQKPNLLRAAIRIQAFNRGRLVRRHVAIRRELHGVSWRMQCLKEQLGGVDVKHVIRIQRSVRAYRQRCRVHLFQGVVRAAKSAKDQSDIQAEWEKNRRMSLIHVPIPCVKMANESVHTRQRRGTNNLSNNKRAPSGIAIRHVESDEAASMHGIGADCQKVRSSFRGSTCHARIFSSTMRESFLIDNERSRSTGNMRSEQSQGLHGEVLLSSEAENQRTRKRAGTVFPNREGSPAGVTVATLPLPIKGVHANSPREARKRLGQDMSVHTDREGVDDKVDQANIPIRGAHERGSVCTASINIHRNVDLANHRQKGAHKRESGSAASYVPDGRQDDEKDTAVTPSKPQTTCERAATATPLGRRLKRPLQLEVARMGGLRHGYNEIAVPIRKQKRKKSPRMRVGSFTLPMADEITSSDGVNTISLTMALKGRWRSSAKKEKT